jgi:hypothetical protein
LAFVFAKAHENPSAVSHAFHQEIPYSDKQKDRDDPGKKGFSGKLINFPLEA